jgi:outer membrane protein assembly factor BamB
VPKWLVAVAAATAVASVVAFVTGLMWPRGGADDVEPNGPLTFHRFASVARVSFDQQSRTTLTAVQGGTGFAAWEQDGNLRIVALDLATGAELWRETATGAPRWSRLIAGPGALLVLAYEADTAEPRRMFVYDPETGAERWRLDVRGDDELFFAEGILGWVDTDGRVLRGMDLATGGERWAESFPADGETRVIEVTGQADLARPTDFQGEPVPGVGDPRVVMVNADRSVRVIDLSNGAVITEGTNIATPSDQLLAYGDELFVAPDEVGYQLVGHRLDELSTTPRIFYTAANPERYPTAITPCGTGRVCLLEGEQFDAETVEAIAVDATDGGELWRSAVPEAEHLIGIGQWVAATTDLTFDPSVEVFNSGGESVLEAPGMATRLNDGNLAVIAVDSDDGVIATGIATANASLVELGRLSEAVDSEQCSWSDRFIICPDLSGAEIWRFAES